MEPQGRKQVIAHCLSDLAMGYIHKYGYDEFVIQCVDSVLRYAPGNISALITKSNYHTLDDFDQIGKFKYNKESGDYTLKTNKNGEAKTHIDNIEKGILSDRINFKTNDQVIAIGGEGQATIGGFESFVTQLSDFVGKEIGGYYLSDKGTDNINYIGVTHYGNNVRDESKGVFSLYRASPNLFGKVDQHTDFHTHPSNAAESDKLHRSEQDVGRKKRIQKNFPHVKRFIILTTGYLPIEY